jgi:hypothetical protein
MQVHHDTAYALSFNADGCRKADEQIVDCGISAADTGSGLNANARQRKADGSHGDEKKLEADNPAMSGFILRAIRGIEGKELMWSHD